MKKIIVILLFTITSTLTNKMLGQTSESDYSSLCHNNFAFQSGEEITYIVYYQWHFIWMDAGEVTFRVEEENGQYHYSVVGETYANYDWFFKVRDYYDTWVDPQTLLPNRSIRDIREGSYTLYDEIYFNKKEQTAYSQRGRSKSTIKERNTFDINTDMHDMLSIIYWARNLDFKSFAIGKKIPLQIFADNETWDLSLEYRGQQAAKRVKNLGYFNTLVFSPELISGDIFPDDASMTVWVTNDASRIPLIIESPVSVGSVKAVLKSYDGLRHPIQSRTKKKHN